jgi:galactose-1-phosphate uridylyltransferase
MNVNEILRNNNCAITAFSEVLAVRNDQIKELKAENINLRCSFIGFALEAERLKELVELTESELFKKKSDVINLTRKLKRLEK